MEYYQAVGIVAAILARTHEKGLPASNTIDDAVAMAATILSKAANIQKPVLRQAPPARGS